MARFARLDPEELKNAKVNRATLWRAWGFARAYRGRLIAYLGTIALAALVGTAPSPALQGIDRQCPAPGHRDPGLVNWLFVIAVVVAVVITGLNLVNRWLGSTIGEGLIYDLRVALYDHVQRMPIAFFTRTQTGSLMSRLSNDVLGAQQTVGTAASGTSDLFTLVFTLAAMLTLSWKVTLLSLVVIPGFVLLDRRLAHHLAALSRRRMAINADLSSTMTERFGVSGALLVKLFGRPAAESRTFSDLAAKVRDSGVEHAVVSRVYYATLALGGALGTAAVYWLGGHAVIEGAIQIGTLTALAAYVARLYSPSPTSPRPESICSPPWCRSTGSSRSSTRRGRSGQAGGRAARRPRPGPGAHRGRQRVVPVSGALRGVRGLARGGRRAGRRPVHRAVGADPSRRVVRGRARPGRGPGGTERGGQDDAHLPHPPALRRDLGAVRIDGRDVRDVTLQSIADAIGVVSQDPHLFHDSISANLRYARPDATGAEVLEACRAARIHDVIMALPDGYETLVGERGYRLSGGEKQRLAIARVLLKRPAIVVLDEATAHLDSESEAQIQEALATALAGRTSIVIAHRLSTIAAADQILVLDRGRIVEQGRHDDLLAAGGLYQELYETQYARTSPVPAGPAPP